MPSPYRIHSRKFLEALTEAGIIRAGDYVHRVVIDAHVDNALIVHVERIGDERLLNVVRTLEGVQVDQRPPAPAAPTYVHRLLDAYLTGRPLNFAGEPVPADVRVRLEQADADGTLRGDPGRQVKAYFGVPTGNATQLPKPRSEQAKR